jgi:hypothetical protein
MHSSCNIQGLSNRPLYAHYICKAVSCGNKVSRFLVLRWAVLPIFLLLSLLSAGQDESVPEISSEEDSIPSEIVINYEFEDRLSRLFSNYFKPSTYFISVRSMVKVAESGGSGIDRRVPESVRLPGIPVTISNADQIRQHPLPDTGVSAGSIQAEILNNDILIFADTSHTRADIDFMQNLARAAIPYFSERGDQLQVISQAFPIQISESEPLFVQLSAPLSTPQNIEVIIPDESPNQVMNIPTHLWVAIGLFIILLTFLLILYHIYNRGKEKAAIPPAGKTDSISIYQEQGGGERALVLPDRILEPEPRPEPDHRTYLMGLFMDRPVEVASLLERWIKLDEQKGSMKAAQLINNVDARFMLLVEKYMSKGAYDSLLEASEDSASREKYETYEDFRDITREVRQSMRDGTASGLKEYEFIQFVDNDQLLIIANETSDYDLALLLRHLPAKRSAWLLDKVGPDRARVLMSYISRDDAINYETFRDSAGMIFEKYFSMQSASSFTKRDIEKIMNTIEELPIDKQEEYLLMLAENAPSLYETIDRRIIIWDRLMMMDEQILKEAIDDIDSRTLAQALNNTSSFIEDVLLNLRPEREKVMIRELMKEETPSKQETEKARRKIVEAIKEINELQKKT